MTSRERVRQAIHHQRPDRIPIDLGATRASGISATVYEKLKGRMGVHTPTKILDSMQLLAEVEPEMLDRLHVDVVPLEGALASWCEMPASAGLPRKLFSGITPYFSPSTKIQVQADGSWELLNAQGTPFAHMPKDGFYFDFIRPTMSSRSIDPAKYQPRSTVGDEELEAFARRAKRLHEETDKAVLGWGASISLLGLSALLSDNITQGSLDEWLCMLMVEKETAHEMMARCVDAAIACSKLYLQAAGDKVMIWGVASDDAGTQRAGLVAPDVFDEMIKPHYRRFNDWIHRNTPWKTFLHSCGSVHEYIAGWIESGIDILNPVQPECMAFADVLKKVGGRMSFWGTVGTQSTLPFGTPADVQRVVWENLRLCGPQGGLVIAPTHLVEPEVPWANLVAMKEACETFRG